MVVSYHTKRSPEKWQLVQLRREGYPTWRRFPRQTAQQPQVGVNASVSRMGGTLNLHVREPKKYIYVSFSEEFKLLNPDAQNRQK